MGKTEKDRVKFVTVVGPMRSGTAAVSEILHMMGCSMGSWIVAPQPPTWRSDWEDADFNKLTFSKIPFGSTRVLPNLPQTSIDNLYGRYLEQRTLMHNHIIKEREGYMTDAIGVKHPFLLFILEHWTRTCMVNGYQPVVICTNRDLDAIARSSEHTIYKKKGGKETQEALIELTKRNFNLYDYIVDYSLMQTDPEKVIRGIAETIGQDDEAAIQRGIASVRKPTWYNQPAEAQVGG